MAEQYFRPGSVILFNAKKGGWFSVAQRFFTRKPYTHCSVVMPPILTIPTHIGADELVSLKPIKRFLDDPNMDFQVYEFVKERLGWTGTALASIYLNHAGKKYGYFQTLWFVWRWFNQFIIKRNIRKHHNWFPNNPICSELTWRYCELMLADDPVGMMILNEWRPDTFHSGDQAEVLQRLERLGVVRKVYERWAGKR